MTAPDEPDTPATERSSVVVVGAGPAGLALGGVLRAAGVDCVVLECETRDFIEHRPRAGVIEEWAVRALHRRGLVTTLLTGAERHTACTFRFEGEQHRFDYQKVTGSHHFVYPQPLLVTDLVRAYADVRGGDIRFGVRDVQLHDLDSDRPAVSYTCPGTGRRRRIHCAYVAGCDGARGVSRAALPEGRFRVARHDYGIGWLALLAETPPSADTVLFGVHPDGFAGQMPRSPELTRFYLQCPPGDDPENWPDDRIWAQLRSRLAADGAAPLSEGPIIEKRVLDMHDYVVEPMAAGRLYLAGDAAHLVAPIAAKGLNLALYDAFLLADALTARLTGADPDGAALAGYSQVCLRRVWDYQEFSQWLSEVYHGAATGDPFRTGTSLARLRRLFTSPLAAAAFAEQYLGTADHY
ncbi:4-hydroxybenzoate 3-monooxygenase [Streptomyces sp. VRA16 Mangrove soil]|uniref:4-hydroxybenzoate 3-monooxygenase n=1 Tax=Streptomyces sp. VRA16 Mangrove soil TaxID=2817434 RepID=UPI001A9EE84D|nr:4-hydroxybenzoate 3-monooxygenase [Streptomyces sp. VRA16 Mangrove soil]MBO1332840.1 4-hydroxybenzoate 3-monooxygenase [Streptomyces sp. VRA16 Mangrove soil]